MSEPTHSDNAYVSRGGLKLAAALDAFGIDVAGSTCVDLGCNVGGFTDCLLQRGAAKVFAIDTGYGALAWKLRNDNRVVTFERTNAMHVDTSAIGDPKPEIHLSVIDLGWTPQRHAIPAALRWSPRRIITLIKPHYEASDRVKGRGALADDEADAVLRQTLDAMPALGVTVVNTIESPIRGGKSKGKAGNREFLSLVEPTG